MKPEPGNARKDIQYYRDDCLCFVPSCKKRRRDFRTSAFLSIPKSLKAIWCKALEIYCPKRNLYVCEDHINIQEDCYRSKSGRLRLKNTANFIYTKTYDLYETNSWKDKGKRKWEGRGPDTGESSSMPQQQTSDNLTTENSSDAEPLVNHCEYAAPPVIVQRIKIALGRCCFCWEIRDDCHQLTHDKPYVTTDKIILTMNDINVEVDSRKDTTPQSLCQSCDTKLQEMYEFVKLVKKAQDKYSILSNINDLRESPVIPNENPSYMSTSDGDDDKGLVIYESLSIADKEFTNKTVSACKRKNNKEEVLASRKKFVVSVDLNSMSSFCDNSNGSNNMYLNCNETDASKETTREVYESVTIKKEIIESSGDRADKEELFATENAIQHSEKQQNTTTSFSETRIKVASETNPVFVIYQESARKGISAVRFAGYSLNIATEDIETLVVKEEDNELANVIVDKETQYHTVRTQMQPFEVQKQVASGINSIVVANNSPKEVITTDDRKKVSENAETIVIKQECIVNDDEDTKTATTSNLIQRLN